MFFNTTPCDVFTASTVFSSSRFQPNDFRRVRLSLFRRELRNQRAGCVARNSRRGVSKFQTIADILTTCLYSILFWCVLHSIITFGSARSASAYVIQFPRALEIIIRRGNLKRVICGPLSCFTSPKCWGWKSSCPSLIDWNRPHHRHAFDMMAIYSSVSSSVVI